MVESRNYVVRPHPNNSARPEMNDLFWVYLSPSNLLLHNLKPGDACQFETAQGSSCSAIVFDGSNIKDSVIQTSKTFQGLYSIKLGDKITLRSTQNPIVEAHSILLRETSHDEGQEWLTEDERHHWGWVMKLALSRAVYLCPGLPFDSIEVLGQRRSFQIFQINGSSDLVVYRFNPDMNISIRIEPGSSGTDMSSTRKHEPLQLSNDHIAGLDRQLAQINLRLTSYDNTQPLVKFPAGYSQRRGGIIIHGPSGTGKSLILNAIGELNWSRVHRLEDLGRFQRLSDQADAVRKLFADARKHQPSMIMIPRLEVIAGKSSQDYSSTANVTSLLASQLDALGDSQVLVIAEASNIANIDDELRKLGRLDFEIETTVPDSKSRKAILRLASGLPKNMSSPALDNIGDRTHGYVGGDLLRLFWMATDNARSRVLAGDMEHLRTGDGGTDTKPEIHQEITEEDLSYAMTEVRPSAMREVFLETPKVRWSDIGGQHHVKRSLKQAIEWPFKYPDEMTRLGLKPKKGLLLYGPPGCSKTLAAKAVATEADLNFIAVKGAELLSMYVGESERAVRGVFRKARSASPSIIFFDEIDALGSSRGTEQGGLNVLTTLLNELDGIEDLRGVFVLAATNNPSILDPALIRPGRLTNLLYVGLPDFEARAEILQLNLRSIDTDPSIDINELADITEGYSGAEIVDMCQTAGYVALEKGVETGVKQKITLDGMRDAIAITPKGITSEQLELYEEWRSSRRSLQ